MMIKKIVVIVCALMVNNAFLHAQKFEQENKQGVKIKYKVLSETEKTVMVTGGSKTETLIIPAKVEYNGTPYNVVSIEEKAFWPRSMGKLGQHLKRVVLPEGLIEIGARAFYGALIPNGQESIYIPSSVKIIGKSAFSKFGSANANKPRDCKLENLPSFVNTTNCVEMGISTTSVSKYLAYHENSTLQQMVQLAATTPQSPAVVQTPVPAPAPKQNTPSSEVDTFVPIVSVRNNNTFAVVIGNENYQKVSKVQFAHNDAMMFAEYCQKTLGLPEKNVRSYKDATYANMLSAIKDIQDIAKAYNGDLNVIFYYAGHGIPNENSGDAFLLPVDADGRQTEVCYPLNRLYSELGNMEAHSVTVFMDACFSGSERGSNMLASARGVAIKAKAAAPSGKMVVFSAASGDETAYPYKEKGHGLFTYFLLKKLQETKGEVSLSELGSYIVDNVAKESIVSNGKSQTPTITPSVSVADTWQNMKLK